MRNEKGFEISREKFEKEFKRFKELSKSSEAQIKIQNLEHLIIDTQKMFEDDIFNLSNIAKIIVDKVALEDDSLQKAEDNLLDLYKPLIGTSSYCNEGEHIYLIVSDWHDVRLRIDLELFELSKSIGIEFKWADTCDWLQTVGRMCPKCKKTKGVIYKPQEYIDITNQVLSQKKNVDLIRKRKPINFTFEDLEADAEEYGDEDVQEYFYPGDVL